MRPDWLHKLSTRLIRENQAISIEDLNIRGLVRNRKLARSISDLAWHEFMRQLAYKALWYGRSVTTVERWLASSRLCSVCSEKSGPSGFAGLKIRTWKCTHCGAVHDRDMNVALNINAARLAVRACRGDVSRWDRTITAQSPVKQETSLATVGIPAR